MSCFIMEPEAIGAIACTTAAMLNMDFGYFGFSLPESLYNALKDCRDNYGYFQEMKIYETLYRFNEKAYCGRYKNEEPAEAIPSLDTLPKLHERVEYKDGRYIVKPWHYRLAKLLHCFEYQCREDATYHDELFSAIVSFVHLLNDFIVVNNECFHSQEWGSL